MKVNGIQAPKMAFEKSDLGIYENFNLGTLNCVHLTELQVFHCGLCMPILFEKHTYTVNVYTTFCKTLVVFSYFFSWVFGDFLATRENVIFQTGKNHNHPT